MKIADKAWLAGILDGEGCVYIGRHWRSKTRKTYYQPGVVVTMTHHATMQKVARLGGQRPLYTHVPSYPGAKRYWSVRWWNQEAAAFLKIILPYLVTKSKQAKLLRRITLIQKDSRKNAIAQPRMQKRIYEQVKILNR